MTTPTQPADLLARAEVCAQLGEYAVIIRDPKFHCIGAFDDESSAISLAEAWNARVDAVAEIIAAARKPQLSVEILRTLVATWRGITTNRDIAFNDRKFINGYDAALMMCAEKLQAAIESLAAHRGEVEWPREAKPAADGDGWVAITKHVEHRMSKDHARVWNACRAACVAAHETAHPPQAQAGAGDAWLPIETAPLGPRILVTGTEIGTCVASAGWDSETPQNIRWEVVNNIVVHPTKWQPLPAPRALEAKP